MKITLFNPITSVDELKSGCFNCVKNYYWMVTESNQLIKFSSSSIQCNSNKEVCERMIPYWKENYNLNVRVEFFPVVLIPITVRDFDYDV